MSYIKEFTNPHPQLHSDSTTTVSDSGKANLFNQFFHSVFTHSNFTLPVMSNLPIPSNHLDSICITEQEVLDALSCLNSNKASGIDKIPPIILKHCASALFLPIHHLFKSSLNNGTIPSQWKLHKIISVFKSGD